MVRMSSGATVMIAIAAIMMCSPYMALSLTPGCKPSTNSTLSFGKCPPADCQEFLYIHRTSGTHAVVSFRDDVHVGGNQMCKVRADVGVGRHLTTLADEYDFVIRTSDHHGHPSDCAGDIILVSRGHSGKIRFATHEMHTAAERERMRIETSGNVGIGHEKISPQTMLHIHDTWASIFPSEVNLTVGTLTTQKGMYLYSGLGNTLFTSESANTNYDAIIAWGDNIFDPDVEQGSSLGGDDYLYFVNDISSSASVALTNVMRLGSDGVVIGGGDAVGSAELTVNGTISSSQSGEATLGLPNVLWKHLHSLHGTVRMSDERFVNNIVAIPYGLDEVLDLDPVQFVVDGHVDDGERLGFKAQQVNGIMAEVVEEPDDENHPLGIRYSDLIPVLVRAIQEQQTMIDEGEQQIQALQDDVEELQQIVTTQSVQIEKLLVAVSDKYAAPRHNDRQHPAEARSISLEPDAAFLKPAHPNPVGESVTLEFYVPKTVRTASLVLYNSSDGSEIWRADIGPRERITIDLSVAEFSSGLYIAVLLSDDRAEDSTPIRIVR